MPFFARAAWPGDHRDELVAGALVGAVVIVLGYASGIGLVSDGGAVTAAPPAATESPAGPEHEHEEEPYDPAPEEDTGGAGASDSGGGFGGSGSGGGGSTDGVVPFLPPVTGPESGVGIGGHDGHGTEPTPIPTTPEPTEPAEPEDPNEEAPGDDESCADDEVRLVGPVLTGAVSTVTELLDDVLGGGAPEDEASGAGSAEPPVLCTGLEPPSEDLLTSAREAEQEDR